MQRSEYAAYSEVVLYVNEAMEGRFIEGFNLHLSFFYFQISKGWILGPELCDMWTSSDVLCCTASILHLVAIAVDR